MIERLDRGFRSLAPADQGLVHGTLLAAALFLIHLVLYSTWFVEDAAITFSFAQHLVDGWGLVAYPGGERVEGFSNPTWTLALASLALLGISPFIAAKLLGGLFGLGALGLSTVWARELVEPDQRHYALIAPFFLAVSPGFAMWCGSGLENSLLSFLVAGAAIRGLGEVRASIDDPAGRVPASGLLWGLVAITRPEAPLYAALGGLVTGAALLRRRGVGAAALYTAGWLALFMAPFGLWHGWRYSYFGWEFPNTYYAKIGENMFKPWGWDVRGWKYLRGFGMRTGQGFLVPLYVVGQSGILGTRGAVGALIAALGMLLVLPGVDWFQALPLTPDSEPSWLVTTRIGWIAAGLAVVPLLGVGRRADDARILGWVLLASALFFGLYSGGDWMAGYRWPSLMVVPMAVLFADAVATMARVLAAVGPPFVLRLGLVMTVGYATVCGVLQTANLLGGLETSPHDVRVRVMYMRGVADKLGLERPSAGEIDMGAHQWWSGFELIDLAGLLDVPLAHHRWEPEFVMEYVLTERRPDFMHVHSFWATRTGLSKLQSFNAHWLEITPYPSGPVNQHAGNHVRRDLLIQPSWEGEKIGEKLGVVAVIEGAEVLSEKTAPGAKAVVRLGVSKLRVHTETRLILFAFRDGEVLASADAPILWDWVRQGVLQRGEVAVSRVELEIPAETKPGPVQLGLAAWTTGRRAYPLAPQTAVDSPVFAAHELHLGELEVSAPGDVEAHVQARLAASGADAEAGRCELADDGVAAVRAMRSSAEGASEDSVRALDASRARCWARWAEQRSDVDALRWAHKLDPGDAEVLAIGVTMADDFEARALEAMAEDDLDAGYEALRDALYADPTRSWLRRRAEELRDRRLGLH